MGIRVVFEYSCPATNVEEVRVVGSLPELGAWDPVNGVPLTTSDRHCWRSAEVVLPCLSTEVIQYKYINIFGGSVEQWEGGPDRSLELSRLSDNRVNYIEDFMCDIDDNLSRRSSGARIRFQESDYLAKSQVTASGWSSRLASSVPSPLLTSVGQSPVEKGARCLRELETLLRELLALESLNLMCRTELRRAIAAVRSAIEVERGGVRARQQPPRGRLCAGAALLLVPLLPVLVAVAILQRVPSARERKAQLMRDVRAVVKGAGPGGRDRGACGAVPANSWLQVLGRWLPA